MKGYTLVELMVVTVVLSILVAVGMPVVRNVIESHRILSTVETMKVLAATADVARRLPGGDNFTNVPTSNIATLLNTYDVNSLGLSNSPLQTYWGTTYLLTTTGQHAIVRVSIPLRNINPFETIATPSGASTSLLLSHQPQGVNRSSVVTSKYNKHHLYLESTDD